MIGQNIGGMIDSEKIDSMLNLPRLMAGWLSNDDFPRLICTVDGTVLWHNLKFTQVTLDTRFVRLDNGQFHISSSRGAARFQSFAADRERMRSAIVLEDDQMGQWVYIIQCERIVAGSDQSIGIKLITRTNELSGEYVDFNVHFKLTPRETSICIMLLSGFTVDQIVRDTTKSSDTVRFHIRNIYRKMGVSSREQFFWEMQRFRFG